ncbi:MAG: translesion DNA synthesis-associated protein ImuA [Luminiphilus sp.]|jgi:protein ImuA|nr:translesion DNA synthesis-associated protein ImuA [Luminiphilus sp.]MDA0630702.1 translesion DNA synthesis-associated protein ImuA [Pseudomonadota bacterium]
MYDPLEPIISRSDTWRGMESNHPLQTLRISANSDWHALDVLPTGFDALDNQLALGGWPMMGCIEFLTDGNGMGAMGLMLPTMEKLGTQPRWLAFIAPPNTPYAPLLAARGIPTEQVLIVHPKNREELLWATEQAIRSTTCSAVFSWLGAADYRYAELRRLQLAATENDTLSVVFRHREAAEKHTPACLRLMSRGYRRIDILKQRGGKPISDIVIEPDNDVPTQPQLWELPSETFRTRTGHYLTPVA